MIEPDICGAVKQFQGAEDKVRRIFTPQNAPSLFRFRVHPITSQTFLYRFLHSIIAEHTTFFNISDDLCIMMIDYSW
jgi:hypothetical protein